MHGDTNAEMVRGMYQDRGTYRSTVTDNNGEIEMRTIKSRNRVADKNRELEMRTRHEAGLTHVRISGQVRTERKWNLKLLELAVTVQY